MKSITLTLAPYSCVTQSYLLLHFDCALFLCDSILPSPLSFWSCPIPLWLSPTFYSILIVHRRTVSEYTFSSFILIVPYSSILVVHRTVSEYTSWFIITKTFNLSTLGSYEIENKCCALRLWVILTFKKKPHTPHTASENRIWYLLYWRVFIRVRPPLDVPLGH